VPVAEIRPEMMHQRWRWKFLDLSSK